MLEDIKESKRPASDAGMKARELLENASTVKTKSRRLLKGIAATVLTVTVVAIATVGLAAYDQYERTYEHYQRICKLPSNSKVDSTAIRTYHYKVIKTLGYTFRLDKDATVETTLQPSFTATNVTSINGVEWSSVSTTKGEPTTVKLTEADTYVFNQGSNTYVISSTDFCK